MLQMLDSNQLMTFKPMLEQAGLVEMEKQLTIQIVITSSSSLTGAQIGTQVAQLGAGLIETTNLIKMDTQVEWVPQGKNRLGIWDQAGRASAMQWLESQ
jgi:hypothetical protein